MAAQASKRDDLCRVQEILGLMQKNLECSICLELMKNPVATKCCHQFCRHCILEYLQHKPVAPCPLCKKEITKRSLSSREHLNKMVEGVRNIIKAFQQDSGYTYSPPRAYSASVVNCTPSSHRKRPNDIVQKRSDAQPCIVEIKNKINSAKRRKVENEIYIEEMNTMETDNQVIGNVNSSTSFPVPANRKGKNTLKQTAAQKKKNNRRNTRQSSEKKDVPVTKNQQNMQSCIADVSLKNQQIAAFLENASESGLGCLETDSKSKIEEKLNAEKGSSQNVLEVKTTSVDVAKPGVKSSSVSKGEATRVRRSIDLVKTWLVNYVDETENGDKGMEESANQHVTENETDDMEQELFSISQVPPTEESVDMPDSDLHSGDKTKLPNNADECQPDEQENSHRVTGRKKIFKTRSYLQASCNDNHAVAAEAVPVEKTADPYEFQMSQRTPSKNKVGKGRSKKKGGRAKRGKGKGGVNKKALQMVTAGKSKPIVSEPEVLMDEVVKSHQHSKTDMLPKESVVIAKKRTSVRFAVAEKEVEVFPAVYDRQLKKGKIPATIIDNEEPINSCESPSLESVLDTSSNNFIIPDVNKEFAVRREVAKSRARSKRKMKEDKQLMMQMGEEENQLMAKISDAESFDLIVGSQQAREVIEHSVRSVGMSETPQVNGSVPEILASTILQHTDSDSDETASVDLALSQEEHATLNDHRSETPDPIQTVPESAPTETVGAYVESTENHNIADTATPLDKTEDVVDGLVNSGSDLECDGVVIESDVVEATMETDMVKGTFETDAETTVETDVVKERMETDHQEDVETGDSTCDTQLIPDTEQDGPCPVSNSAARFVVPVTKPASLESLSTENTDCSTSLLKCQKPMLEKKPVCTFLMGTGSHRKLFGYRQQGAMKGDADQGHQRRSPVFVSPDSNSPVDPQVSSDSPIKLPDIGDTPTIPSSYQKSPSSTQKQIPSSNYVPASFTTSEGLSPMIKVPLLYQHQSTETSDGSMVVPVIPLKVDAAVQTMEFGEVNPTVCSAKSVVGHSASDDAVVPPVVENESHVGSVATLSDGLTTLLHKKKASKKGKKDCGETVDWSIYEDNETVNSRQTRSKIRNKKLPADSGDQRTNGPKDEEIVVKDKACSEISFSVKTNPVNVVPDSEVLCSAPVVVSCSADRRTPVSRKLRKHSVKESSETDIFDEKSGQSNKCSEVVDCTENFENEGLSETASIKRKVASGTRKSPRMSEQSRQKVLKLGISDANKGLVVSGSANYEDGSDSDSDIVVSRKAKMSQRINSSGDSMQSVNSQNGLVVKTRKSAIENEDKQETVVKELGSSYDSLKNTQLVLKTPKETKKSVKGVRGLAKFRKKSPEVSNVKGAISPAVRQPLPSPVKPQTLPDIKPGAKESVKDLDSDTDSLPDVLQNSPVKPIKNVLKEEKLSRRNSEDMFGSDHETDSEFIPPTPCGDETVNATQLINNSSIAQLTFGKLKGRSAPGFPNKDVRLAPDVLATVKNLVDISDITGVGCGAAGSQSSRVVKDSDSVVIESAMNSATAKSVSGVSSTDFSNLSQEMLRVLENVKQDLQLVEDMERSRYGVKTEPMDTNSDDENEDIVPKEEPSTDEDDTRQPDGHSSQTSTVSAGRFNLTMCSVYSSQQSEFLNTQQRQDAEMKLKTLENQMVTLQEQLEADGDTEGLAEFSNMLKSSKSEDNLVEFLSEKLASKQSRKHETAIGQNSEESFVTAIDDVDKCISLTEDHKTASNPKFRLPSLRMEEPSLPQLSVTNDSTHQDDPDTDVEFLDEDFPIEQSQDQICLLTPPGPSPLTTVDQSASMTSHDHSPVKEVGQSADDRSCGPTPFEDVDLSTVDMSFGPSPPPPMPDHLLGRNKSKSLQPDFKEVSKVLNNVGSVNSDKKKPLEEDGKISKHYAETSKRDNVTTQITDTKGKPVKGSGWGGLSSNGADEAGRPAVGHKNESGFKLPVKTEPQRLNTATRQRPMNIIATGLNREQLANVNKVVTTWGGKFSSKFSTNTTHVIVKPDAEYPLACERTLKYFLGIAGNCWVLSYQWIIDCLAENSRLPEEKYEITGDVVNGVDHEGPRRSRVQKNLMLKDFEVFCLGNFNGITTDELRTMIDLLGASLVQDPSLFTYTYPGRQIIITQQNPDKPQTELYNKLYRKFKAVTLSREWLLDSVALYQLQPWHPEYVLCSMQFAKNK